jgi:hypothetical protein
MLYSLQTSSGNSNSASIVVILTLKVFGIVWHSFGFLNGAVVLTEIAIIIWKY